MRVSLFDHHRRAVAFEERDFFARPEFSVGFVISFGARSAACVATAALLFSRLCTLGPLSTDLDSPRVKIERLGAPREKQCGATLENGTVAGCERHFHNFIPG